MLPIFVLIASHGYRDLASRNAALLSKIYPRCRIVYFDCGPGEIKTLDCGPGVALDTVDWRAEVTNTRHLEEHYDPERLCQIVIDFNSRSRGPTKRLKKWFLKRNRESWVARRVREQALQYENMFVQKVVCLLEASRRIGNHPFVFLDADAFLFETIDELFELEADVAMTIVPTDKIDFARNHCVVINSGVIAFGARADARQALLDAWYEKVLETTETWREQTALVRFLESRSETLFAAGRTESLRIGEHDVAIAILPCEEYNLYHIYEDYRDRPEDIPRAKVYHFANLAQNSRDFERIFTVLRERLAS